MGNRRADKEHPLVIVEWLDAHDFGGEWKKGKKAYTHKPALCEQVGWMVKHEDRVTLYAARNEDDQIGDGITIPIGCVKKIRKLK